MKLQELQKKRGFTLVETLVAVTILVIGTLGPLTIAAQGISSAGYAKDQIVAYYLAQEGIEFIRNYRDSNAIKGYTNPDPLTSSYWLTNLDNCLTDVVGTQAGCRIDAKTPLITTCESPTCRQMTTDNNGYYGYTGSNTTTYTRTIKIKPSSTAIDNAGIRTVEVTVDWSNHGKQRTFVLKEDIYASN